MDLKLVREEAIEATNRAFWDRSGFVPDEDSDEWEDEYRRQFDLAKKRHATDPPADTWLGGVDRSAHTDPMGCRVAGRPDEGGPRSRDPQVACHHLDPVKELDRHE